MKALILLVFLKACCLALNAQQGYTIRYQEGYPTYDSLKPWGKVRDYLMAINDSVSYSYYKGRDKDSIVKPPYGKQFRVHAIFVYPSRNLVLDQRQGMDMVKLIVVDTLAKANWILREEEKLIAGYWCKKATAVYKNRELTAFYSPELPASFGPYLIGGLPGTILEMWWEDSPMLITAAEVKKEKVEIIEPRKGKRISKEAYDRKLEKARKENESRIITIRYL